MFTENTQKTEQQFMTCQTEQQDSVTPIQDLTPGTLFRFRFESPWKYFMVVGYGTTDKVPAGFPKETIKFLIASKGIVGEMPLFRFKSVYNNWQRNEFEVIK